MRIALRTILLLISTGILVVALLPPQGRRTQDEVEVLIEGLVEQQMPTPTPEVQDASPPRSQGSGIVREMLGGAQIDAGLKAKDVIGEVNEIRQQQIDALDAD